MTCLFLLANIVSCFAQQWQFDSLTARAYQHVLNLEIPQAFAAIPHPQTTQQHYVIGLAEALELLLTEDKEKFERYEDHFNQRVGKKMKASSADLRFLKAELHLQWAFVYLKFGKEIEAARHFKDAYNIATACREKYPQYLAIKKTTGLMEIIIGSVPEKYNWVLDLLNMDGTIDLGLKELNIVIASESPLASQAELLLCLVKGYVFQNPDEGLAAVKEILSKEKHQRLALFLAASLAMKNFQSELALAYLNEVLSANGLPIHYASYLKGDVLLHKGKYPEAIASYKLFISNFKGTNNLKDAAYKIALCYHLNGNAIEAVDYFERAKTTGREIVEADKSAARSLNENKLPNIALSKVRYATDGGYFKEASQRLSEISDSDLPTKKDQVEYYYRKARLEHLTARTEAAKLFYRQVIDMAGNENWYFAPNSCLQMGYILIRDGEKEEAKQFFEKALSYKKHEYKNSIDSKARSALSRL